MSEVNAVGGILQLAVDGQRYDAKGSFKLNAGALKREAVVGAERVHGYKVTPQTPYVEGMITDRGDLDLVELANVTNATVTVILRNGKTFVLRDAWYAADGELTTEEGEFNVRFEGLTGEWI